MQESIRNIIDPQNENLINFILLLTCTLPFQNVICDNYKSF